MKRLTSDKPVAEMGMYELALNSCYIKDGKVRVRDFENDSDARELTRKILEDIADDAFIDNTDETFDGAITDYLQYGTSELVGLIAVFYRNLCAMADLRERLKKYEDLEEQGKLLKLPCAVGDTVYEIIKTRKTISEFTVMGFSVSEHGIFVKWKLIDGIYRNLSGFNDDEIGKTVFLAREEAEGALKEMEDSGVCEPEYLGENVSIGCRVGQCKCGNIVRSYQKFCDECGIKLDWGNTHKE